MVARCNRCSNCRSHSQFRSGNQLEVLGAGEVCYCGLLVIGATCLVHLRAPVSYPNVRRTKRVSRQCRPRVQVLGRGRRPVGISLYVIRSQSPKQGQFGDEIRASRNHRFASYETLSRIECAGIATRAPSSYRSCCIATLTPSYTESAQTAMAQIDPNRIQS